jgi:hypothetical protein
MSSILKVDTIQNTGGTTGLTIDSNGRLGVSNPIIFYGRKNDVSSYTTVGTIVWNVSMVDTASAYNTSTGLFTCPKAGHYEIHWNYLQRQDGYLRTTAQKNGSHIYGSGSATMIYGWSSANEEDMRAATCIVNCAVNDTLNIRFENKSSNADIYFGNNSHNGFTVKFLG